VQDSDLKKMSITELRRELARVRSQIRKHKKKKGNQRCHHNDRELYSKTLPEGDKGLGYMDLSEEKHYRECVRYVRRQKCPEHGCNGKNQQTALSCPNCGNPDFDGLICSQCGQGTRIGKGGRGGRLTIISSK
jgi:hypothetical protein